MYWQLIVWGIVIGVAVAAPIGPINLMAIRNTLTHGFWAGLFTGTGAVLGDGTFAVFAAFGITAVSEFVIGYATWIQSIGGVILTAVGLRIMLSKPQVTGLDGEVKRLKPGALVVSTYVLTITNPATMMGFLAIFGGVGNLVSRPGDYAGAGAMVAAVMFGSFLWWLTVSWFASLFRRRIAENGLRAVNLVSGAVIVCFGLGIFVKLLWS